MRQWTLLFALLFIPLGLALADDDAKKDDKKTDDPIAGTWKCVSYEDQRGKREGEEAPDYVLSFKGGKYSQKNNGTEDETGTYKLDTSKKPATIDLDIKTGNDEGKKQPGIFKMDGDKLKICFAMPGGDKRPEKFEIGEGQSGLMVIFKREKE